MCSAWPLLNIIGNLLLSFMFSICVSAARNVNTMSDIGHTYRLPRPLPDHKLCEHLHTFSVNVVVSSTISGNSWYSGAYPIRIMCIQYLEKNNERDKQSCGLFVWANTRTYSYTHNTYLECQNKYRSRSVISPIWWCRRQWWQRPLTLPPTGVNNIYIAHLSIAANIHNVISHWMINK